MSFLWSNPTEHFPFRYRKKIGPGPKHETNKRADKWDCECEDYFCVCEGIARSNYGQVKKIWTNRKRKKKYNKMYRKWRKRQGR